MWKEALIALLGTFPQAAPPDPARLAADKDPDRRVQAVELARRQKDPRLAPVLLGLLADPHPKVRWRALLALSEGAPLDFLLRGLRSPQPLVRQGTCEALGRAREKAALPALLDRLSDPDPRVQGEAAAAIGRIGDRSAAERLIAAFRKDSDWPLRAEAVTALAALGEAASLLEEAARDRHYQVRLAVAETGRPEVLGPLVSDRDWRVRAAAIDACPRHRDRAAIGWLVDQLAHEKGRLRWDIVVALHDLTGKDLGLDPKPWKAWWDVNRETFVVPAKAGPGGPEAGGTQASFFKIPILSTRILFVLDLSGSMREPASPGGALTKLDVARQGMLETLRDLPPDARFGILGLGCDEDGAYTLREKKTWQGRLALLPAHPPVKADAERFLRSLEARGWTNLYDGIEYAFADPDVDTIFLYSDGGASKGAFVAAGEILEHVSRMNRFRRIVIHTVEVPAEKNAPDNRKLLVDLARATRGFSRPHEKPPSPAPERLRRGGGK